MKSSPLRMLFLMSLVLLIAGSVFAADKTIKLTVKAGDHDRKNTPVCVVIDAPKDAKSATITLPGGKKIPGQLTEPGLLNESAKDKKELHFILPELAKGKSAELTATLSAKHLGGGAFCWFKLPINCIDLCYVRVGKFVSVLRYMCLPYDPSNTHDTYKVFHHVYAPDGSAIITKGPGGRYTHHRGIFYGFRAVTFGGGKHCDIWHCKDAHQSHEGVIAEEAGPVLGRHTVAVGWYGGDQKFANEKRELTVYSIPGGRLIEFASRLESPGGKVKLDGDPQHAGFQFRASQKVADGDQKNTYYLRTDGKGRPGETRNWPQDKRQVNRPWNAMSFVIDGNRYTAEYIDKPTNPKEARYSERTYGRFGSYFVAEFDEGDPLTVNYRIWLQDGEMTLEGAQALRDDFVEPVEVEVK